MAGKVEKTPSFHTPRQSWLSLGGLWAKILPYPLKYLKCLTKLRQCPIECLPNDITKWPTPYSIQCVLSMLKMAVGRKNEKLPNPLNPFHVPHKAAG